MNLLAFLGYMAAIALSIAVIVGVFVNPTVILGWAIISLVIAVTVTRPSGN